MLIVNKRKECVLLLCWIISWCAIIYLITNARGGMSTTHFGAQIWKPRLDLPVMASCPHMLTMLLMCPQHIVDMCWLVLPTCSQSLQLRPMPSQSWHSVWKKYGPTMIIKLVIKYLYKNMLSPADQKYNSNPWTHFCTYKWINSLTWNQIKTIEDRRVIPFLCNNYLMISTCTNPPFTVL